MSKTIDIFKNFLNNDQNDKKMEIFSLKKAIEDSMQLIGIFLKYTTMAEDFLLK